jgi:hypothetical protein
MSVNARGVVVLSLALGGFALTSALVFWPSHPPAPAVTEVPPVVVPVLAEAGPKREHAAVCDEIAKRYHDIWWSDATGCAADSDCTADPRGGLYTALDGCARFGNGSLPHGNADTIATQWAEEACAWPNVKYVDCAPLRAQCRWVSGGERCVERPPDSLPRDWQRLSLPAVVSVFAPPDFVEKEESEWSTHVRVFAGDHRTLVLALGPISSRIQATDGEREAIDGHFARVEHLGADFKWRVTFEEHWPRPIDGASEVTFTMSCSDDAVCEPWQAVLRSTRFMTQPVKP